ncbi:MAG: hypothetical protein AAFQ87_06725 [Bacteroidota bacterium]
MSRFIVLFASFLFLSLFQTSCKFGVDEQVSNQIDTALALIEEGIRSINDQSDQWRNTLEYIHSEMPETLHWVKDDVSQLISEGIGATTSNVLCVIDAIPNRMIHGLQVLKAKLLEQTPPSVSPTVCNVSLSTINLNAPAFNRAKIIVNGYDFVNDTDLQLFLRKTNGQKALVHPDRLLKQSDYQYTINIANWDNTLQQYAVLVMEFDGEILSEFAIIPKEEPEIKTFELQPPNFLKKCPTHIGGDREFDGNGPNTTCRATLSIVNQDEVWVEIYFHVKETKSDWTEARYRESFKLGNIPNGFRFNRYLSDTETIWTYTDTDHSVDTRSYSSAHLVKEFRAKGDTGGNDVGNCTNDDAYLSVLFHKVRLEIIEE